ncbi:hypothetical protein C361_06065 [Cryptococcus neoformans Tu259-1]|uniref:Uncharacterized protein n=1 Tax=Cryptococcus neoformans Tu259-1 TaxID=1230072 RepID=A0A854Q4I8_CRYNE|nr:hypothetical protein C356_05595 [Cryptococcus neoformans var. grubii c45]OXG13280.1 hypothetical protein C361_06065 [Cryptococcus neoformans var. grubii Tu259-1]OXG50825.1 hypothetical protein C354_05652 [Cryptococcus neoformans var. grubii MW-RSA1955]OXH05208.1 hypothetical protein C370_05920 [Cryptococcus neoformans var. grubii A1-35-8]
MSVPPPGHGSITVA